MIKSVLTLPLAACLLNMSVTTSSLADEDQTTDREAENCINVRTLRRTDVIDDQHIIFYMSGKTTYLNIMPKLCRGLSRNRRFSYSTTGRSLCSFDAIRILHDSGGGLQQGRLCRLGQFLPITREDAAEIIERSHALPQARPPSLPDIEDVTGESDEASESSE